jgi:hypothetical protein
MTENASFLTVIAALFFVSLYEIGSFALAQLA